MKSRCLLFATFVLAIGAVFVGARLLRPAAPSAAIWTPAPVTALPPGAPNAAILPTLTPAARPAASPPGQAPAVRPAASPTANGAPTRQPAPAPTAAATPDRHRVIITEADVLRAMVSGAGAQGGLALESPGVRFTDDRMQLTAARLQYGPVDVRDLVLVGQLVAREGRLQLNVESIVPRGLVTALIPSFANQALAQYAAQWYVEEVRTLEGRLELQIK